MLKNPRANVFFVKFDSSLGLVLYFHPTRPDNRQAHPWAESHPLRPLSMCGQLRIEQDLKNTTALGSVLGVIEVHPQLEKCEG